MVDLVNTLEHRVLNDLKRAKVFCDHMNRFRAPPPSLSKTSCVSPVEFPEGGGSEGVGVEPNHIRPQESLALFKSFSTLCWIVSGKMQKLQLLRQETPCNTIKSLLNFAMQIFISSPSI